MLENTLIRFFIVDSDSEEVEECEFLEAKGSINYKRHTVRENGCSQIVLTKGLDG